MKEDKLMFDMSKKYKKCINKSLNHKADELEKKVNQLYDKAWNGKEYKKPTKGLERMLDFYPISKQFVDKVNGAKMPWLEDYVKDPDWEFVSPSLERRRKFWKKVRKADKEFENGGHDYTKDRYMWWLVDYFDAHNHQMEFKALLDKKTLSDENN